MEASVTLVVNRNGGYGYYLDPGDGNGVCVAGKGENFEATQSVPPPPPDLKAERKGFLASLFIKEEAPLSLGGCGGKKTSEEGIIHYQLSYAEEKCNLVGLNALSWEEIIKRVAADVMDTGELSFIVPLNLSKKIAALTPLQRAAVREKLLEVKFTVNFGGGPGEYTLVKALEEWSHTQRPYQRIARSSEYQEYASLRCADGTWRSVTVKSTGGEFPALPIPRNLILTALDAAVDEATAMDISSITPNEIEQGAKAVKVTIRGLTLQMEGLPTLEFHFPGKTEEGKVKPSEKDDKISATVPVPSCSCRIETPSDSPTQFTTKEIDYSFTVEVDPAAEEGPREVVVRYKDLTGEEREVRLPAGITIVKKKEEKAPLTQPQPKPAGTEVIRQTSKPPAEKPTCTCNHISDSVARAACAEEGMTPQQIHNALSAAKKGTCKP